MKLRSNQEGVTLVEVLVGFVIFTSSLVAILNYVSGQVYHSHLSSENLQKVQLIYNLSSAVNPDPNQQLSQLSGDGSFNFSVSSSVMDSSPSQSAFMLNRYEISVSDSDSPLTWILLNIN